MGDIADMMLDGTLCEGCGVYMGDAQGIPGRCAGCAEAPAPRAPKRPVARSSKADLPKWKQASQGDTSVRYHCNHCLRHFPTQGGADDHVRGTHRRNGATP